MWLTEQFPPLTKHLSNICELCEFLPTCACNLFYGQDALWRRTGLSMRRAPTHGRSPASQGAGLLSFLYEEEIILMKVWRKTIPINVVSYILLLGSRSLVSLPEISSTWGWGDLMGAAVAYWCPTLEYPTATARECRSPKRPEYKTQISVKTSDVNSW